DYRGLGHDRCQAEQPRNLGVPGNGIIRKETLDVRPDLRDIVLNSGHAVPLLKGLRVDQKRVEAVRLGKRLERQVVRKELQDEDFDKREETLLRLLLCGLPDLLPNRLGKRSGV